jgi:hypothetical protein
MTAAIVPFPLSRRIVLIKRQAARALQLRPDQGIRHINRHLVIQADALRRRGVGEELIAREVASMSAAIRTAMGQAVFSKPGGAA